MLPTLFYSFVFTRGKTTTTITTTTTTITTTQINIQLFILDNGETHLCSVYYLVCNVLPIVLLCWCVGMCMCGGGVCDMVCGVDVGVCVS